MADTRVQREAEQWVRESWMPGRFARSFSRKRLKLSSGGEYDFDAVSNEHDIVATISTSGARTAAGKSGVGKLLRVRSDIYFLLLADIGRRVVVLTEKDMHERCLLEQERGRVPRSIEFQHAELPVELRVRVQESRRAASKEVTPS